MAEARPESASRVARRRLHLSHRRELKPRSPRLPTIGRYRRHMSGELAVVEEWLDAVNRCDGATLTGLSHPEIEIVGPRGAGQMPSSVLSQWLLRAGFSAKPLRWFCGDDGRVVVEQAAQWHDVESREQQDRRTIGSRFVVREGLVAAYARHDDGVEEAVAAAGLDVERDEVKTGRTR